MLVALQLLAVAGVFWPGGRAWEVPGVVVTAAVSAVLGGGLLSTAGLLALGRDLTPFVDPKQGAPLRTTGVYAVSRNPVYAGLLVALGGIAVLRARPEPLVAVVLLAVVLHVKAGAEEHRLRERYGREYEHYAARVPRLVGRPSRSR